MRAKIIDEIRRLAAADNGRPPGRAFFEKTTGIKYHEWYGVFWARWGDALAEAGFQPNKLQGRLDKDAVTEKVAEACRALQKFPTDGELRIYGKRTVGFPSHSTVAAHFVNRNGRLEALREWAIRVSAADVLALLPAPVLERKTEEPQAGNGPEDGWVYLIQSGAYHKIGRSAQIERRVKEIKIAMPEAADMIHAIQTDDPSGIEAYWHRRFVDRRVNGEWFKLTRADVSAFKRRKFQ